MVAITQIVVKIDLGNMHTTFVTVFIIGLLAVISPGPDFIIVTRNSLLYSRKVGVATALGIATGNIWWIGSSILGISYIISQAVIVFTILKYLGALYLIYLGIGALRSKGISGGEKMGTGEKRSMSLSQAFRIGLLTNILNPKCALFFMSFFSLVINPDTPAIYAWGYGLEVTMIAVIWFSLLATVLSVGRIKRTFERFSVWLDRVTGAILNCSWLENRTVQDLVYLRHWNFILHYMNKGKLIFVTGLFGAGKTTLTSAAVESIDNLGFLITYTTRNKRVGESVDGEYVFVSLDEYEKLKSKSNNWDEYTFYNNYYGNDIEEINKQLSSGKNLIVCVAPDKKVIDQMKSMYVVEPILIWIDTSLEVSNRRLVQDGRGERIDHPMQTAERVKEIKSISDVVFTPAADTPEENKKSFIEIVKRYLVS